MTYDPEQERKFEEEVGSKILSDNLENKIMKNGLFKLVKENVYSALVYGFLSVALVVISNGTVFGLDWKVLVDVLVLGVLTSAVKNLLTTNKGNFAGVVSVIPDKK